MDLVNLGMNAMAGGGKDGGGGKSPMMDLVSMGINAMAGKVIRWQNLIPSFPWIPPGWRVGGAIQGRKEGVKFCSIV